jgi:hypothetical protein
MRYTSPQSSNNTQNNVPSAQEPYPFPFPELSNPDGTPPRPPVSNGTSNSPKLVPSLDDTQDDLKDAPLPPKLRNPVNLSSVPQQLNNPQANPTYVPQQLNNS